MTSPYRDQYLKCPACQASLRAFGDRLCCDACNGIFIDRADLERSLGELTQDTAVVSFVSDRAGKRACPRCTLAMTECGVEVAIAKKRERPWPVLDRCDAHGVWFDALELAKVFELVHGVVSRKGYGSGRVMKIGRKLF